MVMEARRKECTNTGRNPSEALALYHNAAKSFQEIINLIDPAKEKNLIRLRRKVFTREIVISFLVGCLSSAFITYLFQMMYG